MLTFDHSNGLPENHSSQGHRDRNEGPFGYSPKSKWPQLRMIIIEHERVLQNSVYIYIGKIKDSTLALPPGKLRASSGPKVQHVITDQRTRMHPMLCHETVRLNETAVFFFKRCKMGRTA